MISGEAALALLDRHVAGRVAAGAQLWTLLVLSGWMEHLYARLPALRSRPLNPTGVVPVG
jgi:hypothetical protein